MELEPKPLVQKIVVEGKKPKAKRNPRIVECACGVIANISRYIFTGEWKCHTCRYPKGDNNGQNTQDAPVSGM